VLRPESVAASFPQARASGIVLLAMTGTLYALACALLPAAWGVLMYVAFGALDRRRKMPHDDSEPPIDYSI